MVSKNFNHTIRFRNIRNIAGNIITQLPIVEITLVSPNGKRSKLPLLFDTGASVTTLIHTLYPLIGVASWDVGQAVQTVTANGPTTVYKYTVDLELFGKSIRCPVHLSQGIQRNSMYLGLLGRDTFFNEFGFGFWESAHELYVTANP